MPIRSPKKFMATNVLTIGDPIQRKRILILDIDQTVRCSIADPTGFIQGPADIRLVDGVLERMRLFKKNGYILIGVSNQGGVSHGYKTMKENQQEMEATAQLCTDEEGAYLITEICFEFAMEGAKIDEYNFRSLCRKPEIGMLAIVEHRLVMANVIPDWNNSLVVGDRQEDCELASNAQIPFMWASDFASKDFTNYDFEVTRN